MSNRVPSASSATNFTLRRSLTALFCRIPGGSRGLILIAAVTLVATGLARTTVEGRHGEAVGQEPAATAPDATIDRVRNPQLATDLDNLPGDLRTIVVPEPANLGDFVKDRQAAIALGKALFWDMQVGSDGIQACASCHFRAGADPRSKNQVSPGLKHVPAPDMDYKTGDSPNWQLQASHFPLTRLASPGMRGALDPGTDSDDVVSSQGIHHPGDEAGSAGFSRRSGEHAPRRAAQYTDGHQRRIQPSSVLGWPCRERVQRREPSRRSRSKCKGVPRRSAEQPDRGASEAGERQSRLTSRRAHRERPRDGGARAHPSGRRQRPVQQVPLDLEAAPNGEASGQTASAPSR